MPAETVMTENVSLKAKVCLLGEPNVGKTSLIRRYVQDEFDDHYLVTVGTKVSKKEIQVPVPAKDLLVDVDMMVWDIMGQREFRDLLAETYFEGAQGILAVADVTRQSTFSALYGWIDSVDRVVSQVPVLIALNKADLAKTAYFGEAAAEYLAEAFGGEYLITSAKTGANVEKAFGRLAAMVVERQLRDGRTPEGLSR